MLTEQHIYTVHKRQSVIMNNSCSWSANWKQWTCRGQFTFKRFSDIFGTVTNNIPDALKKILFSPGQAVDSRRSRLPDFTTIDTWRWQCRLYALAAFTSQVVWFDWFHKVPGYRHTYSSQAWAHVTSGKIVQCRMRVDQCASEIAPVKGPLFFGTISCSNEYISSQYTSIMLPRHSRDTGSSVLSYPFCNGMWVGRGGHLASDTWLLSRDRTVCETRAEGRL
jgi:hypothetical protein